MVTRLPLRDDGLRVTIRYEEPWASLLPADQRPVGKEYATLDVVRIRPRFRWRGSGRAVWCSRRGPVMIVIWYGPSGRPRSIICRSGFEILL